MCYVRNQRVNFFIQEPNTPYQNKILFFFPLKIIKRPPLFQYYKVRVGTLLFRNTEDDKQIVVPLCHRLQSCDGLRSWHLL